MTAWWSGSGASLLAEPDASILATLAHRALSRFRVNEAAQLRAWQSQLAILRTLCWAVDTVQILLEFEIPRLGGRIDAVLLLSHAVLVIEFKNFATVFAADARAQLESYVLDLQDFHAGSRRFPIVPILVATDASTVPLTLPFLLGGLATPEVLLCNGTDLPSLVRAIERLPTVGGPPLDRENWETAPYHPVPNVIDAACRLFARHDVAELIATRADARNLSDTAGAIDALLARHRSARSRVIIFVTGIPGAGKTLCGLHAAFAASDAAVRATFLTGNPSLVHVLREALVRSVSNNAAARRAARHHMKSVIQGLPKFRDDGVRTGHVPAERVVVIDEAQRSWTESHAIGRTRNKPVPLDRSEPAHLLDIMARHDGFSAIICLIGNGQEIHDGEGGLAAWSEALELRPDWHIAAAPVTLDAVERRNRLAPLPMLGLVPSLHLDVAVRALRHDATPRWVDYVLAGDAEGARRVIRDAGAVPFRLTRDLDALRRGLRVRARNIHRAGLVCSAGARRLRAEGLGCEVPHMDPDAVSRWFLDSWTRDRDVRASDALELVATQFSVQGLELDHVGLCWDGDLVRVANRWQVRSFRGTAWQRARDADKIAWRLNTYRVLLTRARFETLIWVPRGDKDDETRDPALLDGIADFLLACGVSLLDPVSAVVSGAAPMLVG